MVSRMGRRAGRSESGIAGAALLAKFPVVQALTSAFYHAADMIDEHGAGAHQGVS